MSDIEKLGKPPKKAIDKFDGTEKISVTMIESENIQNLDKVKGSKKDIETTIEDFVLAKAHDNTVYKLEDGTITHEKPTAKNKNKEEDIKDR